MACLASLRSRRPRAIRRILPPAVGVMVAVWLTLPATAPAQIRSAWNPVGSATLQDGRLVLTESSNFLAGAAWRLPAVKLPPKFKAAFDFAVSEPMGLGPADGFAFVIQGFSPDALGGLGGGLGYTGMPNSVAVEFDTWANSASDFGSPTSVADPAVPHISIHTRGPQPNDVDEQYSLGASTDVPFLSDGTRHSVVIRYKRHMLSVTLDGQPKLRVPINLRERLEFRNRCVWFGFTAATGGGTERHEILSYRLKRGKGKDDSRCDDKPDAPSDDKKGPPSDDEKAPPSDDKEDSPSEDEEDSRSEDDEDSRSEDEADSPSEDDEDSRSDDDED